MDEAAGPDRQERLSRHERADPRDSMLLQATMRIGDGDEPVGLRIRNLSASGLMAEAGFPLPVGAVVSVELRNIGWVAGAVAWSDEARFGVAFDSPIDPHLARKPVGTHANESMLVRPPSARSRRPGLRIE